MRIAIIGNNDGPARLAKCLEGSSHKVVLLGLQKNAPAGMVSVPDESTCLQLLGETKPDLVINCFANFIFKSVHKHYQLLNLHLAPLPAYRGRHPLQWALINGENRFGATIHAINDGIDAGPIFWQGWLDVKEGWSAVELREELFLLVEASFAAFIDNFLSLSPKSNPESEASYVTRRYPKDSELTDWSDHQGIYRKVSALRHDASKAYVEGATQRLEFIAAVQGARTFIGFQPRTVVAKAGSAIEVVCEDGRTVWLTVGGPQVPSLNQKI